MVEPGPCAQRYRCRCGGCCKSGWTFHRADANTTDKPRRAMTVIYMADGTRLKAPENPNQQADWDQWCPGASIGEPVATALNPLLYPG